MNMKFRGEKMKKAYLYVHGKGGNAGEAEFFKNIVEEKVFGVEYNDGLPWIAKEAILEKYEQLEKEYDEINVIANSIGAYFSALALSCKNVKNAFLISPVVDMERLILDMMSFAKVDENELQEKGEIETTFGETLSWKYLCFVRNNPVFWNTKFHVLYGENDNLTSKNTIEQFVKKHNATLLVMKGGEHWFHTKEQTDFLANWLEKELMKDKK